MDYAVGCHVGIMSEEIGGITRSPFLDEIELEVVFHFFV